MNAIAQQKGKITCLSCKKEYSTKYKDDGNGQWCDTCSDWQCGNCEMVDHGGTMECIECEEYARYVNCHECSKEISLEFDDDVEEVSEGVYSHHECRIATCTECGEEDKKDNMRATHGRSMTGRRDSRYSWKDEYVDTTSYSCYFCKK